ncbi:hypothetical protein I3760_08G011000 [Carya illinoinensis]|uniref:Histone acetyltransferase n=3 Tax=Carya illinoinensis TaxID=32201 RepID=A0A922E7V7_CARIL|nr:hypothetical protein I3760_08G011000 [Carya illinoinensis]KAG6698245.1 hypothetical protein I3842_08G011100 [Carya illinoinensis]
MKELGKMPRPGPRPYECVRKAWHSDRHHPIRGSLIQEIFRVVEKVHSSATRKNKEWQEKLPIVVIKAEEIMYSKANSEAEYMDLKTLWDRATNAINTIIRRDESTETGKFLQPCIEAALNLGCTARRASRSQRNCNPKCYLTPSIQETLHTSSGTVENAFQGNHTTNLQYLSRCSKLVNPASLIPTGPSNFIQNIDYASNKYPFASESVLPSCNIPSLPMKNYTVTNFCSVYPLCYVNDCPFEESQDGFGILPKVDSSTSDPAQVGIENLFSCNVDALYQMTETNSSGTPEKLCKIGCDLSLRLGPVSDTCPSVGNSKVQLQDVDSGNFPNGRKFCYQSLEVDKKLSLIPGEYVNGPLDLCSSKWIYDGERNVEETTRKRKAVFDHPAEDQQLCWQPKLPCSHLTGSMRNAGL